MRTTIALTLAIALATHAHAASLQLDKKEYFANEEIHVQFSAPATWPENAWVGIVPSDVAHGSEQTNDDHDVGYEYLNHRASGTLTLQAPAQPGSWDVRMNDSDDHGKEVTSVS